jgi:CBS domain-containing protein
MPNKIKLLLFIIILATGLLFYSNHQHKNDEYNDKNESIQAAITNNKIEKKPSVQQLIRNKKKVQGLAKDDKKIKNVVTVYDDDPVVDAHLIMQNNRFCFGYLRKSNKKREKYIKRFERNLDAQQLKFYSSLYQHCQKINQQHPEYHLTDINILQKQITQSTASSLWGKILNQTTDVDTLSDVEIIGLLKSNNPNILSQAPQYLSSYYHKVVHWDLEDVLNNQQYDYTQLIQRYTHQLYLCQIGSDCSPNSSVMVSLCFINSRSCGLSYPQFVQQGLSTGQQADIQLAMAYFKNLYQ